MRQSLGMRYALAVGLAAAAAVLEWVLVAVFGVRLYTPFYPVVLVAALYGGLGPGLACAGLCGVAAVYLLIAPARGLWIGDPRDAAGLALYLAISASIVVLAARHRVARGRLEDLGERTVGLNRDLNRRVEELQTLLEALPVGIFISEDAACGRIVANSAGRRMLGIGPETNASKTGPEAPSLPFKVYDSEGEEVPSEDLPMQQAARWGVPLRGVELDVVHTDGRVVNLFECASPLFDERGKVRGCVGVFVDMSDRRRQEEALRESEQRFRMMADSAPVLIWVAGTSNEGVYFNRPWLEFTGRKLEQELGFGWLESAHPEDKEAAGAACEEAFAARRPFTMQFRLRRADGEYRWVQDTGVPRFGPDGSFAGYVGSCVDVTERRHAEEGWKFLVEASERLASSLEYGQTLREVAELAVPRMADWCVVDLLRDDGRLERVAVSHVDPQKARLARELAERYPVDLGARHGVGEVLRSGRSEMEREIGGEMLERVARDGEHLRILRELGLRSYICVPLVARGRMLGVMSFVTSESGRRFGEGDLALAETLGRRAALAVDNAWLYESAEREVAERQGAELRLRSRVAELQRVHALSARVAAAGELGEVFELAMDALMETLGADRASVLLFDADGVMRFKAWRGLSEGYRAKVEGHTPWRPDSADAAPILSADVLEDESLAAFRETIVGEGIRALAFVPLVLEGRVLGKFMVYYNRAHACSADEVRLAVTIANHVSVAIERTRGRAALERSEQRARRLIESNIIGVVFGEASGRITEANDAFLRIVGRGRAELERGELNWREMTAPESAEADERAQEECARAGVCAPYEKEYIRRDGRRAPVLVGAAMLNGSGSWVCCVSDLSEQKRTEDALRQSQERLEIAMEAGRMGAWEWSIATGRVVWSPGLEMIHGLEPGGFGGRFEDFLEHVHPEDREEVKGALRRTIEERGEYRVRHRVMASAGRVVWLEGRGRLLVNDRGDPATMTGVCMDITEAVAAEEELARHRERLEELVRERTFALETTHERLRLSERMAALGTLSAGLGHDIGNLLLPLRARLDVMRSRGLSAESREDASAIEQCADYLQSLTRGLRLFARDPESDIAGVTELAEWRRDAAAFYRNVLPKNVEFVCEVEAGAPAVGVAPHRLTQAVLNLVNNSRDAIGPNRTGRVEVRASRARGGEAVCISVSDNGSGMLPEVRSRVLEPFFTTKTRGISTGLGLSLVHAMVEGAGGEIEIDSEAGMGTTIRLVIPAAEAAAEWEGGSRATITLRDRRVGSLVSGLLRAQGFEVSESACAPAEGIWVLGAGEAELDAARAYAGTGRRVVVVGEAPPEWDGVPGVAVLRGALTPERVRGAVAAGANGEAAMVGSRPCGAG